MATGRAGSAFPSSSASMTAADTSGWSPRATSTALAVAGTASKLAPPGDRTLDRRGVIAEDDDDLPHPGVGHRIEHVLEHRPAADRRQELSPTEARRGTRGQDQPDG